MYGESKKISLYYKDYRSDKEYHLELKKEGKDWKVYAQFGPRGGTLTHVDKSRGKGLDYYSAEAIFDKTEKEKRGRGYKDADPLTPFVKYLKANMRGRYLPITDYDWESIAQAALLYLEENA